MRTRFCLWLAAVLGPFVPLAAQDLGITGEGTLNQCESKAYTLSLVNNSGNPLTGIVLSADLAGLTGFSYVAGTTSVGVNANPPFCTADPAGAGSVLTWDVDTLCGTTFTLNNGETLNLAFSLRTGCGAASGSLVARADFEISGTPVFEETSRAIGVLPGGVTIRKTPAVISREIGQNATWTLIIENTGLGTIRNVVVTDVLGTGLQYVSSTPSGVNAAQTTTWGAAQVPGLAEMDPGDIVTIDLTAKVIACDHLDNAADVRWGCDLVTDCFNTAVNGGTATASVQRVVRSPSLGFTPPDITFSYCNDSDPNSLTVTNLGDGTAFDVQLYVDFSPLTVATSSVPYNAGGYFELGDIAPGGNAALTFTLANPGWCAGTGLARPLIWMPHYQDDCGTTFYVPLELSTVNPATSTTDLTVTLSGAPGILEIGDPVTYNVSSQYSGPLNCGPGSVGTVTVTDTVPNGFTVLDGGGGVWVPGGGGTGGTVTWTYQPPASLNTSLTLQSPSRAECETYCHTAFTNALSASVADCCGCALNAAASHTAVITCQELATVTRTAVPSTSERCGEITYTNTYTFSAGANVNLNDLVFTDLANHQQQFVSGSLSVVFDGSNIVGGVVVTDTTPGGTLDLDFSGCSATSVNSKVLEISYRMTLTEATAAACAGTGFYAWAGMHINNAGSGCLVDGEIYEAVRVEVEAPAMALSLTGLPLVMDKCRTQTATLTLTQTSAAANPRDVRLVLSGLNYRLVTPAATNCSGSVSPVSCTPALVGDDYVWTFNDDFTGAGQSCSLQFDVQKRCAGGGDLTATAFFDDHCHDNATPDDTCSTTATASPATLLGADLAVEVSPEVYYAASTAVEWTVTLTNRGAGTAYNVWADHVLGAGMVYDSAVVDDMTGVTVTAGFNHAGGVINGATVAVAVMLPGERREITFRAQLVDTTGLTLNVTAAWGCVGQDCQLTVSDGSTVVIATPMLVATAVVSTPVDACADTEGTITLRNAGQAACYNLQVTDTLPAGLLYTSGSTRWRVNGGGWNGPNAAYDPSPTTSPLSWTSTEIPGLAVRYPGDTLEIDYDLHAVCPFTGGTVTVSTRYETPGGDVFTNPDSTFPVTFHAPDLRVTKTRANNPVGCEETLVWTITVENRSGYTLPIVWVEDTLDAAFTYISSAGDPPFTSDNGTNSGQVTTWELKDLPHGTTAALTLTAATDAGPCSPDLDNTVRAWWGCGVADGDSATKPGVNPPDTFCCLAPAPVQFVRTETRQPALATLSVGLSPASIDACNDSTQVTFEIANTGPTDARSLDVVFTLPPGLTYNAGSAELYVGPDNTGATVPVGGPTIVGNQLIFYNIGDKDSDLADPLQAANGNDTLVLKFGLKSSCYTTANLAYNLYYYDCCGDIQYNTSGSQSITALYPNLAVTQTPATAQAACGTQQTWTLTVTNTGSGNAQVVRLEDTPGTWITLNPAASTPGLVNLSGGVWGWEFNNLAPGASQSFTLAGTLNSAGNDCTASLRQNNARAIWGCGTAGEAVDNDPTTTGYDCTYGIWANAPAATLQIPNLTIGSITPSASCTADGTFTGSLTVQVLNTGDGNTGSAFVIQASDGKGWTGTYTHLVGIAGGGSANLVVPGAAWSPAWVPACTPCSPASPYGFTVTVDAGNAVCECNEGDNTASGVTLNVYRPELSVGDIDFTNVTCTGDQISGTVRVQVVNNGCAAATNAVVRLSTDCGLTFADRTVTVTAGSNTWTTFTIAGGNWTACTSGACSFTAVVDPSNAICECAGGSHALTEPLPAAYRLPDLDATSVSASASCSADGSVSGTVSVTLSNLGPVAVNSDFYVLVDDGRGWTSELRYNADLGGTLPLAAGTGSTVTFNWTRNFTNTPYVCTFPSVTALVDSQNGICECTAANNQASGSYNLVTPNLRVLSVTPSCASDGLLSVDVVVDNNGCAAVSSPFTVQLADNDGHSVTQTVNALAAGGQQTLTFSNWPADGSPATLDFTATADYGSAVCELSSSDNTGTASLGLPNLRLIDLTGPCTADGLLRMALRVENIGAAAVNADFDVSLSDNDGHARTAAFTALGGTLPLAIGAVQTLHFEDWPVDCAPANPQFTAVADPGHALCEGSDADNTLGPTAAAPALPDLVVPDVDLSALRCDGGVVSGSASVTVRNDGSGPAGPFVVRLTTTAGLAFADLPVAALAAGDSTTLVFPAAATLPDCTLCGADFTAEADPAGAVCECRGDNNTRTVRPTAADKLYWTDEAAGTLQRAEADGTSVETVLSGLAAPRAVTLDGTHGKAYWVEPAAGALRRANLDGTLPETLLTGLGAPVALAVDPAAGKLYWTDAAGVHRANTDGTGPGGVVLETGGAGIALDTLAGRLYFTRSDGRLRSARFDGTDLQDVIAAGLGGPYGLALDNRNGKLCFSDPVTGLIQRVNPDGTGLETLLAGLGVAVGHVAVNPPAETLYYETRGAAVARVGFDGSGAATVVTGLGLSSGVAVLKLNTAPAATALNQSHAYLQGAVSVPLDDIVVTDPDFCERVAAVLTLADPSLGSLSAASGHGETYDPASGRWAVTGPVADVNAALADVAFLPVPDNAVTETVSVRIRDASGAGPADGSLVLTVIPYPVISGAVRLDGAGVASVAMAGLPGSVVTNGSGLYSAVLPHAWSGTVTPALAGYFFTPASRSYVGVAVDQPNQDYAATALTTTVLASAPNPSVYGDTVTLTATLTSAFGPPHGTVRFLDGAVEIGTGTLSAGTTVFTTNLLAGGSHTLTAVYDGAAGYQASTSAPVTHLVNPAPTATSLSSAPNPSVYGDNVTLTAVVSSSAGTPSGTVTFTEGAVTLGTSPLAGGTAVLVIPSPPGGPHVFTAAYSGSTDHQPSVSAPLGHTVNPAPTATALSSAPNPSVYGDLVTLTAVVSSPTPTPAGTVAFFDGAALLGTGTLDGGGTATLTTAALTGGVHTLSAAYAGTANHAPSASPPLAHTVNRAPTSTVVTAAPNPSVFGQPVTFTATVTAVPGVPTGSVQFRSDGTDLAAPVPLTGGTAALTVATLAAGSHVITAEYLPGADPNYAGSTGTLAGGQTVLRADTATTLVTTPNPSRFGQPVTLTASVTVTAPGAGTPSGTVTFLSGATPVGTAAVGPGGTAVFTTASLPVGVNSLTARYEGDASFNPSVSPATAQTVEKADTATTVESSRNPAESGETVTFTVTVAAVAPGAGVPGGTVELRDGTDLLETLTLAGGSASWTTDDLAPGRHPITAAYAGSGDFNPSVSDTLFQEISRPLCCAHVTSTDLWWTRIHLLNTGDRAAGATLEAIDAGGALLETVAVPALPPGGLFSADAGSLFSAATLDHDLWVRVVPLTPMRGLSEFGTRDGLTAAALPIGPEEGLRLVFPYVYVSPAGSGSYYTGITLVNPETAAVQAVLEAFSEDGAPLGTVTVAIPARGKYVRLVGEAFPGVADPGAIRFVRVAADGPLTGFELFGKWDEHGLAGLNAHFPDAPCPPLNGEELLPYHLYYNEVPDNAAWYTGVTFVNLDPEPVTVTAEIFSAGGEKLGAGYWGVNPLQQVTREIWTVLGAEYPSGSWLKASAVRRVLGFELFLSRGGPFRFDGLPAQEWPARRLVFPLVRTAGGNSTRLRLTNVSGLPVELEVRAYAADGTARGAWPAALAVGAQLQADLAALFPSVPDLAWIAVEASGGLIGDALLLSADQERMVAYPGLRVE